MPRVGLLVAGTVFMTLLTGCSGTQEEREALARTSLARHHQQAVDCVRMRLEEIPGAYGDVPWPACFSEGPQGENGIEMLEEGSLIQGSWLLADTLGGAKQDIAVVDVGHGAVNRGAAGVEYTVRTQCWTATVDATRRTLDDIRKVGCAANVLAAAGGDLTEIDDFVTAAP